VAQGAPPAYSRENLYAAGVIWFDVGVTGVLGDNRLKSRQIVPRSADFAAESIYCSPRRICYPRTHVAPFLSGFRTATTETITQPLAHLLPLPLLRHIEILPSAVTYDEGESYG
jgi:hypothetical protein